MSPTRYCPRCLTTFQEEPARCPNLGCRAEASPDGWPTLLGVGDVLDRTYRILEVIAGGAAGMTYLARELDHDDALTGPQLAIKVLYDQRDSGPFLRRLATEAQILQELDHPHIVECLGFVHRAGRAPYLVTRFEAGGTLHSHVARVGPLPPPVAAAVVADIVDALGVAHRAEIVHRDLKPGNVLLREEVPAHVVPDVKVADFGIAKIHGSLGGMTRMGAFVGTPEFAAPEQLLGKDPGPPADLFAAGGLLWTLLTGTQPVALSQRHDPIHTYDEVVDQVPPRLTGALAASPLGPDLQAVLDGLMAPEPDDRWTARKALRVLRRIAEAEVTAPTRNEKRSAGVGRGGTIYVTGASTYFWDDDDDDDVHDVVEEVDTVGSRSAAPAPPDLDDHQPSTVVESAVGAPPPLVSREVQPPPTALPPGRLRIRPPAEPAPEPPRPSMEARFDPGPEPVSTMEGLMDFGTGTPPTLEALSHAPPVSEPEPSPAPPPSRVAPPPIVSQTAFPARPAGAAQRLAWAGAAFEGGSDEVLDVEAETPDAVPAPPLDTLPEDPAALLGALGQAHDAHHDVVVDALRAVDERDLGQALRDARRAEDPLVRRGAALAVAGLDRVDQLSLVRNLMRDPSPAVRAASATALGRVGSGSILPQLARLVADADPGVRAAAALAVAEAYRRDGDVRRGREQLARLGSDQNPEVRRALAEALGLLDG